MKFSVHVIQNEKVFDTIGRLVRASDCQCQSRNTPELHPSVLRHSIVESEGRQMKQCWIKNEHIEKSQILHFLEVLLGAKTLLKPSKKEASGRKWESFVPSLLNFCLFLWGMGGDCVTPRYLHPVTANSVQMFTDSFFLVYSFQGNDRKRYIVLACLSSSNFKFHSTDSSAYAMSFDVVTG